MGVEENKTSRRDKVGLVWNLWKGVMCVWVICGGMGGKG